MFNLLRSGYKGSRTSNLVGYVLKKHFISTSQNASTQNTSKGIFSIGVSTDLNDQPKIKNNKSLVWRQTGFGDVPPSVFFCSAEQNMVRYNGILNCDIVRDITVAANGYNSNDASKWLARALQYNVPNSKKNRVIQTVLTYKSLMKSQKITKGNIKLAYILGWTLSTIQNHSMPLAAGAEVSEDEIRKLIAIFPDIVRDITEAANGYNLSDASKWLARALQYNVPNGKKNRVILTVLTYKSLMKSQEITKGNMKLAYILGWCVEMLQCCFIISDDVMDNSSTRRGQPCWHKLKDVGLMAINDALMIENAIYILLKKYFSHMDCYIDLLQLFHEVTFITTCGQCLDLLNATKSVNSFDIDKYNAIVANKTAYYSFYLPFALAMHLAGIKDQKVFQQSKSILLEMGHFFQVQDDYLDCFGNPDITGKIGTDIQDNKCSWLAVVCMQKANEEQKQIMIDCYGKNEPEKAARVKELYKELCLPDVYAIYEEESYNAIKTRIKQMSHMVPHEIFQQILNKIYQRDA